MLRQLHHLAEAESKLSTHQKRLSEIEVKVDLEHPFIFARIKAKSFEEKLFLVLIRKVSLYANWLNMYFMCLFLH